jgi:ubiquinone/menaquinone biosynthesis C-methylase UbiE
MREFRRVLKPNGVLMAFTLGESHMHQLNEAIHRAFPEKYTKPARGVQMSFSLENGADQIRTAFNNVVMIPYVCDLRVEDAEPTVDYARSAIEGGDTEEGFARLREAVAKEISEKGNFFIKKETGMFVARGYANA